MLSKHSSLVLSRHFDQLQAKPKEFHTDNRVDNNNCANALKVIVLLLFSMRVITLLIITENQSFVIGYEQGNNF
jgi:hypothetical protein